MSKRWKWILGIIAAVSVVALVLGHGLAQEAIVQEFEGSGGRNTRPFDVAAGWEVQWNASGDIFQLYLYDASGGLLGVAANQMGPGTGASFQAPAGTFYLQVNAIGSWTIRIVQLGLAAADASGGIEFSGNGKLNTRPFNVEGPWEVQWTASGDIFQIYLHTQSGNLVGVAANQMGSGSGASYQPNGGNYYLQVNAVGEWVIRIVPVD